MKILLLIVLACSTTAAAVWAIMTPGAPPGSLFWPLTLAVFVIPPVGASWMLYLSIRHESHPLPLVFLSFVPYAFLWYYFERVRTGTYQQSGRMAHL